MQIQLQQVSKSYADSGQPRQVLRDLSLSLPAGRFTLLLGKSGSGKSTLLNLLSGIDAPDSGSIWLGETCLSQLKEPALTRFRRQHIGIVFQFFHLLPTLSVLENVSLPAELAGLKQIEGQTLSKRGLALLDAVGLADRAQSPPERLSGGQQQRVAIARALICAPALILADEPTGNLDEQSGQEVMQLLLKLSRAQGKTLVMVSHDPEWIPHADQVYRVHDGQLEPVT
ncbi:MAG: ABC transporter ATP-binding protein [Candidatus Sericytochromatia bacterium]|nr:ABC transporter ATP-binding protein [Candidatus Sericytochromatia bacterium]